MVTCSLSYLYFEILNTYFFHTSFVFRVVFRDAVAQAGTGPALVTIKQWILNHKISGTEAAHIVGVLPDTAYFPTTEYINTLFVSDLT